MEKEIYMVWTYKSYKNGRTVNTSWMIEGEKNARKKLAKIKGDYKGMKKYERG